MPATSFTIRGSAQRNQAPRPPSGPAPSIGDLVAALENATNARRVRETFASVGATLEVRELRAPLLRSPRVVLHVRRGADGEYFDLAFNARRPAVLRVREIRPEARQLTLEVADAPEVPPSRRARPEQFLCGRDQAHWFVEPLTASLTPNAPAAFHA